MHRVRRALGVRPGEGRTVGLLLSLMVLGWAGAAIGATGVESLFFARFGPRNLPWMYIALGVVTFPTTLAVAAALGRFDRRRALVALPLVLAAGAVVVRLLLTVPAGWVYPATWLSMMVMWIVQGTFSWGVAGMVHDTRQAKRLFPLYGAGLILGGALGGLATGPLAAWLHAENLVLAWAGALVGAYVLAGAATEGGRIRRLRGLHRRRVRETGLLEGLRQGATFMGRSSLLRWMSASMVLLALLSFAVSLPFAKAATGRFPEADRLAQFLGVFQGVTYGVALVLSLLLANRLLARLGVATVVVTFPLLYAIGFLSVAAAGGEFGALVGFRFLQLAWMYGVWQTGWQALFNVVPPEQRERARTFMDGAAMQAGIILAGGLLLLAQEALSSRQLFLVAAAAAVLAVMAALGARRAYTGAVGEALRAGWPEVFVAEEEPFGGMAWSRDAVSALERGARDPDPGTRRVVMELLAGVPLREAAALRLGGLSDADPGVRAAAVAAVARFPDPAALPAALELLSDPDPAVRAQAVDATFACTAAPDDVRAPLRRLLEDPDARVRARAAVALHRSGDVPQALESLRRSAASPVPAERAAAVTSLGELGQEPAVVAAAVADQDPGVRRAAGAALGAFPPGPGDDALFGALSDDDPGVREVAAVTLAGRGAAVAARLTSALADERRAEAALLALARVPVADPEPIRRYAVAQRDAATRYHTAWRAVAGGADARAALLAYAVRSKAVEHARRALRALSPLTDREAVEMALENVSSRDPSRRANALEMIEAVAEPDMVRPLVAVWDPEPDAAPDGPAAVRRMLDDPDPWLRACAAQAAVATDGELRGRLAALAERDVDRLVRETAARALRMEDEMRTLSTLSLMERMMALRQVPLFRELAPADLRRVAEAAVEHLYPHATLIAEAGEPGDAMHVVVTGEVRVVAEESRVPVEIARRGPGYIVGEMAILSDQPRMASLVAEGDVRTLSLDRGRFQRILRDRPDAALAVVRELCVRLREAHAHGGATS